MLRTNKYIFVLKYLIIKFKWPKNVTNFFVLKFPTNRNDFVRSGDFKGPSHLGFHFVFSVYFVAGDDPGLLVDVVHVQLVIARQYFSGSVARKQRDVFLRFIKKTLKVSASVSNFIRRFLEINLSCKATSVYRNYTLD